MIGTGRIGRMAAAKLSVLVEKVGRWRKLIKLVSLKVLCFDVYPDHEWIKNIHNASYVDLETHY